jgi:hypothetical protein
MERFLIEKEGRKERVENKKEEQGEMQGCATECQNKREIAKEVEGLEK